MITFRGSGAGYCTRQIVSKYMDPDAYQVPEKKRPFLDAGHNLQEAVEAFIIEHLPAPCLNVNKRESEGIIVMDMGVLPHLTAEDFTITGHVDGIFDDDTLLEVKAIMAKSYRKLEKAVDWREVYGHYRYQAQVYQSMFNAPGTHFVYYNRDTSEMMGSLPINHEAYTPRPDMYEEFDQAVVDSVIGKYVRCVGHINEDTLPDGCDAEGYCFFCRTTGSTFKRNYKRIVSLDGNDPDQDNIAYYDNEIKGNKESILAYFDDFKANQIELEDGRVFKRRDYE